MRNTSASSWRLAAALACLFLVQAPAWAFSGGVSGYSGRLGADCSSCHGGGGTPTVSLTGPNSLQTGATGNYTLTITGGAAIDSGIDVSVDNANALLAAGTGSKLLNAEVVQSAPKPFSGGSVSYSFSVKAPATAGSFTLFAAGLSSNGSGTNGDGTAKTSLAVTVTAPPANQPPAVALNSPTNGSTFTAPANINLAATASDADGSVAKVEFFAGATKLGEDLSSPFTFAWANVAAGSYSLTAKATDNLGASTTSAAVNVTVAVAPPPANQAPVVALSSPANGSSFNAPANLDLAATASDADGSVAKVEFFAGATKLGEDLSSPFTFTWANVAAGSYSLTAKATDNLGASTTSAAVNVTVRLPATDGGVSTCRHGRGKRCRDGGVGKEDEDGLSDELTADDAELNQPQGCNSTSAAPTLVLPALAFVLLALRRARRTGRLD